MRAPTGGTERVPKLRRLVTVAALVTLSLWTWRWSEEHRPRRGTVRYVLFEQPAWLCGDSTAFAADSARLRAWREITRVRREAWWAAFVTAGWHDSVIVHVISPTWTSDTPPWIATHMSPATFMGGHVRKQRYLETVRMGLHSLPAPSVCHGETSLRRAFLELVPQFVASRRPVEVRVVGVLEGAADVPAGRSGPALDSALHGRRPLAGVLVTLVGHASLGGGDGIPGDAAMEGGAVWWREVVRGAGGEVR